MKKILVYFGTDKHSSPYDILFAYDTGFDVILPYNNVQEEEIISLIQDIMFARGEEGVRHTTILFGGSNPDLVNCLAEKARKTMFPPYQLSILQDPEGAYTTAAALVVKVIQALLLKNERIEGKKIVLLGGTGPVGKISATLLIGHGADVIISSRIKRGREFYHTIIKSAEENRIEGIYCSLGSLSGICTRTSAELLESAGDAQIILSTSHPGIEMLKVGLLTRFKRCLVAADISAVQPLGIADIGTGNDLKPINDILTLGGLTIGRLKSKVAVEMLNYARKTPGVYLDCNQAFKFGKKLLP